MIIEVWRRDMLKQPKIILLAMALIFLDGCASLKKADMLELKSTLIHNSMLNYDANVAYVFLGKGDLIYVDLDSADRKKKPGKWFVAKAQESNWKQGGSSEKYYDVLCILADEPVLTTAILTDKSNAFRCSLMSYESSKFSKWGTRFFRADKSLCIYADQDANIVRCNSPHNEGLRYTLYGNYRYVDPQGRFIDLENGVIDDTQSNLQWMRCSLGDEDFFNMACSFDPAEFTSFSDIERHISELNRIGFGGFHDWRLPTLNELLSASICNNGDKLLPLKYCDDGLKYHIIPNESLTYITSDRESSYSELLGRVTNKIGVVDFYEGNSYMADEIFLFRQGAHVQLIRGY